MDVTGHTNGFNVRFVVIGCPLTLLSSIVLVRLAVSLPYVAIKVIEIVGRDVRNAVQLKEVSIRGQSPENEQQPPHDRQVTGRPRTTSGCFAPLYFIPTGCRRRPDRRGERAPLPRIPGRGARFALRSCPALRRDKLRLTWTCVQDYILIEIHTK